MDKGIIVLIALTVAVSGCTDLIETDSSPEGIEPDPGQGLEISELSVADNTLRAGENDNVGQRTELRLELSNHHDTEIKPQIELSNTGRLLDGEGDKDFTPSCNKESLDPVTEETVDQMECTWGISAPDQDALGAFDQKDESVTVIINYDSQIINQEPLQFQFRPRDEITDSNPVERKFSNNEVVMTIRTDNPSAMDSTHNRFEIAFDNSGDGNIDTEEGYYNIDYTPSSIFQDCPGDGVPRIESEFTATCSFNVDSESQRNVFVSASYKYQKQQTLPITIVR